jgi:hypothetical protein
MQLEVTPEGQVICAWFALQALEDRELPGLWSAADLVGGETDT